MDNPLRSALSMINIQIVDTNEYGPMFDSKIYFAKLNENSKKETQVIQVSASDQDKNRLEYSIVNSHETPFYIEKYQAIIRVNGRLDYEMKPKHTLQIIVSDGKFTDSCTVEIEIQNLIDKAPYFEYSNYNFKIKIPNDVYIGQVKAIDVEHTSNLTYSLRFKNAQDSRIFCVSQTGVLYICSSVVPSLNYKSSLSHDVSSSLEDFLSEFTENEYVFNVSVSIYSEDLMSDLETLVEVRVQIEHLNAVMSSLPTPTSPILLSSNSTRLLSSVLHSFDNTDDLFKESNTIYVLFGTIGVTLVLILVFISAFCWLKFRSMSKNSRHSNKNTPIIRKSKNRNFSFISQSNKRTGSCCSRSSSEEGGVGQNSNSNSSCKNSTSGISSCLSVCSHSKSTANMLKNASNIGNDQSLSKKQQQQMYYLQWEEKPGDNGILYGTQYYTNENSPMSKVTVISDYTDNEIPISSKSKGDLIKKTLFDIDSR
jgi:hypothetical protein